MICLNTWVIINLNKYPVPFAHLHVVSFLELMKLYKYLVYAIAMLVIDELIYITLFPVTSETGLLFTHGIS